MTQSQLRSLPNQIRCGDADLISLLSKIHASGSNFKNSKGHLRSLIIIPNNIEMASTDLEIPLSNEFVVPTHAQIGATSQMDRGIYTSSDPLTKLTRTALYIS